MGELKYDVGRICPADEEMDDPEKMEKIKQANAILAFEALQKNNNEKGSKVIEVSQIIGETPTKEQQESELTRLDNIIARYKGELRKIQDVWNKTKKKDNSVEESMVQELAEHIESIKYSDGEVMKRKNKLIAIKEAVEEQIRRSVIA